MATKTSSRAAEIRAKLDHPIIDSDGHILEVLPVLLDFMKQVGGADVAKRFEDQRERATWMDLSPDEIRDSRATASTWWLPPTKNTLDRATASLPRLLAERMDELGLDFCVLFPTTGLVFPTLQDDELRQVTCRAYNMYLAEVYGPYAHRMTPAMAIPMHTPEEAIEELEFGAKTLGLKAATIAGFVRRRVPAVQRQFPKLPSPHGTWVDSFGADSEYDYDPFWAKCIELGIPPASHSAGFGFTTNAASTSFMQNHLGHFTAVAQVFCKSLFFGGITYRFPELRVAVLECGVGWAVDLYAGIIGRWEKRNVRALQNVDPAELDVDGLMDLYARYGDGPMVEKLEQIKSTMSGSILASIKRPAVLDDWSHTPTDRPEDIRDRFVPNFFFGCEADDPMNPTAFDAKRNPLGARLGAMLSSDIGHWDVPDMGEVVPEAYEFVEKGLMTAGDFRDFTFTNPVRFYAGMNPNFFKGTVVEAAVSKLQASGG